MVKRRVLIIAPHADDETLGMGATIAKKMHMGEAVTVAIMTGHGTGVHPLGSKAIWDTVRAEAKNAAVHLGHPCLEFFELPAVTMSEYPIHKINRVVADVINSIEPHEIYLPFYHDLHLDHRLLCNAGLVAARAYLPTSSNIDLVAMYEVPTETHLMPPAINIPFTPNHYQNVSGFVAHKLAAWDSYKSQQQEGFTPRSPMALKALAMLRGSEIGVEAAEGFVTIRSVKS